MNGGRPSQPIPHQPTDLKQATPFVGPPLPHRDVLARDQRGRAAVGTVGADEVERPGDEERGGLGLESDLERHAAAGAGLLGVPPPRAGLKQPPAGKGLEASAFGPRGEARRSGRGRRVVVAGGFPPPGSEGAAHVERRRRAVPREGVDPRHAAVLAALQLRAQQRQPRGLQEGGGRVREAGLDVKAAFTTDGPHIVHKHTHTLPPS